MQDAIIERARYYADKIHESDMLDEDALKIGATLAVGETNIVIINLLTRISNAICSEGDNGG
jgi:hypothetical protein